VVFLGGGGGGRLDAHLFTGMMWVNF